MHYHLIGIAGTAMASVAGLLRAAGHTVTGSDENVYPPMSDQLRSLGISYQEGYRPENVSPRPEMVIVGNAISRGNPELEQVLDAKIPYTSAAVVVKETFLRGRTVLAVAGTHGKTTTTSLLAWILEAAGLSPSFLIGGVAENFGTSFRLTDSPYFVVEADEYDTAYFDKGPKMWHYLPDVAVVTNIEFDHADIYRDEVAYRWAFSRFINLIPRRGRLVVGWDSPIARELAAASFAPIDCFGFPDPEESALPESTMWLAHNVRFGERTQLTILRAGEVWSEIEVPLAGAFNVRNVLAAVAAATAVSAEPARIAEGLSTFRSVRRRMEVRGTEGGVTVVDDFAHHPTAVRETIAAARQLFPERRVVALFEPRSYTAQRREFQDDYEHALATADSVVIAGLFHPERYTKQTGMDPHELIGALRARGVSAMYEPDVDAIVRTLTGDEQDLSKPYLQSGDVALVMSNGGFGGIHLRLLGALRERNIHHRGVEDTERYGD
jgi:UDP-N-acetylmuramate: L-alanyl-gamma-D-glutamyl-meso-diaminopimelate ligase